MSSVTLILIVVFLLILLNGFFACMEIALVSVSRARLRRLEKEKRPGATAALFLQRHIDDFFATVQIGITFVGTLSAAIGGDASVELFTPLMEKAGISPTSTTGRVLALVGIALCISYVSLVVGELVPKSLARRYPGTISTRLAGFFKSFSRFMTPAVRVLSGSTSVILRILRVPESKKPMSLTTEEFRMMAAELVESQQITERVHDIVVRASRIAQIRVEDVMIPRHQIVRVQIESADDPKLREKALAIYKEYPFSYFPVTDLEGEEVYGVINVKDLLLDRKETSLMRPVAFCARGVTLDRLLATMQMNNTQITLVVDEHGVIDGVITLEDILEEFVGEIEGSAQIASFETMPTLRSGKAVTVEGTISLHELKETLSISLPSSHYYSTLAGFLLEKLERIPVVGDSVAYERWNFQIVEMAEKRIKRVKIVPLDDAGDPPRHA